MRLLACHIENYGKLSQKDFDFVNNIVEFNWVNGSGKTTLVSFIKAMLYGLSSTKINAKLFDDRQHFFPFNYGKFGGSLTLESGGDEYRIERFFDKKSATSDSLKVYKNGVVEDFESADVGKKLLDIDEATFLKIAYFDASDTEICTPSGIESHIHNYEDGDMAKKVLQEQLKKLRPERGKNGKIFICQEQVRRLREEISVLQEKNVGLEKLYEEKNKKQKELLLNESNLKEQLVLESKLEDRMFSASKQHAINVLKDMFITGMPTDDDFERIDGYIKTIKRLEEENGKIKEEFDAVMKKSKRTKLLIAVDAFMIITVAVLLMVGQLLAAAITVMASGVMAIYLYLSGKKIKTISELNDKRRKNILRCDFCLQEIHDFMNQYIQVRDDIDYERELEKIKTAANNYAGIKAIESEIQVKSKGDFTEINANNNKLKTEIASLDRQIIRIETEIESLDEKMSELVVQEEMLEEYKNQFYVIEAAKNALFEAENNLKNKCSDPIKENFFKYSEVIEDATGKKIIMDDKYNVYFEDVGERQNNKHLSQGEQSILAFCFKMALIDSLYEDEKPFVLLDDPFVNLDGENMSKMAKIIKNVSKDRQVIYFCCHESRNLL